MNKDSFYRIVIIALLLLNIGMLAYLWSGPRGPRGEMHGRPPRPDELIHDRLQLTDKQTDQFDELKHDHHEHMLELQEQSAELHERLYKLLQSPTPDTTERNNILAQLQENYHQKELVTFDHFQKLRDILNEDQKKRFDDLVGELSRQLIGPPPEGRHP
jgi:Spy/CpxP family protein refolding chaperone